MKKLQTSKWPSGKKNISKKKGVKAIFKCERRCQVIDNENMT